MSLLKLCDSAVPRLLHRLITAVVLLTSSIVQSLAKSVCESADNNKGLWCGGKVECLGVDTKDVKTGCPTADWPDKGEERLWKLVHLNRQLIVQ